MQSQKEQDKIADYLVGEALDNYTLVKTFNAEKIELDKYSKVLDVISKIICSCGLITTF